MNLQQLVHQHADDLSDLEQDIIQYIMENTKEVQDISIACLSDKLHVSKSSVLRLSKKLGFSGFSEFKYYLRQESEKTNIKPDDGEIYDKQLSDIIQTLNFLKTVDFLPINELLYHSKTIYCYSTGFSQKKPLEEFSKMMLSLGKRVLILPNKTELDMAMPMITREDCVIIASVSGETPAIKENLTTLKFRGIETITFTLPGNNYFARNSSYHLNYYCTPFSVGIDKDDSLSLISLHCLVDFLFRSYTTYTLLEE